MSKKAVTPAMAARIAELRQEKDDWGDQKWSYAAIAEQLGVSESTVWRADSRRAAYAGRNPVIEAKRMDAQWQALENDAFGVGGKELDAAGEAAAAASLAKVQELMRGSGMEIPETARAKAKEFLA